MDNSVESGEAADVDSSALWIPRYFPLALRISTHEACHLVPGDGEEGTHLRTHKTGGAAHEDAERSGGRIPRKESEVVPRNCMAVSEKARQFPIDKPPGEDAREWLKGEAILDRIVEDRAPVGAGADRVGMTPCGERSAGLNIAELFSGDVVTVFEAPRKGHAPERSRTDRHTEFDLGAIADAAGGPADGDRLKRGIKPSERAGALVPRKERLG
jgi:hypothetical protein